MGGVIPSPEEVTGAIERMIAMTVAHSVEAN
jgi:hypothetical protein